MSLTAGSRYASLARLFFDFRAPLWGWKVSGWNPICVLETTFFSFLLETRHVSLRLPAFQAG